MSSAKRGDIICLQTFDRSFIWIMNKRDPRMEPCGTSQLIPILEDSSPLCVTYYCLSLREFGIISKRILLYHSDAVCEIKKNSNYKFSIFQWLCNFIPQYHLSHVSRAFVCLFFVVAVVVVAVVVVFNPNWSSLIISNVSKKWSSLECITFSKTR